MCKPMNMNSLVLVADAASARLFRTANSGVAKAPIELIEMDAIHAPGAAGQDASMERASLSDGARALALFARDIADRAAEFAHYHFCNPIIVVAGPGVSASILSELERALPNAHIRRVTGDMAALSAPELMHELLERAAFTPLPAKTPGQIEV